jgi:hypothetical protein
MRNNKGLIYEVLHVLGVACIAAMAMLGAGIKGFVSGMRR